MSEQTKPSEAVERPSKPQEKPSKKAQKKSGEKSDYTVKNESRIIKEFLRQLEMHEADAIIACISIADGKANINDVKEEEQTAINVYLNSKMTMEKPDAQAMLKHRLNRSFTLAEHAKNFCESSHVLTLSNLLAVIATEAKMVEDALKSLTEGRENPFGKQASLFDESYPNKPATNNPER